MFRIDWPDSRRRISTLNSFRLDPKSVADFFDSWPAVIVAVVLGGGFAYLGIAHLWGRITAIMILGIYGGYVLRGTAADRLREKYPGARWIWLLAAGMTTAALGVASRMAFPAIQGTAFNLAWIGVSFVTILVFIVANRNNPAVKC